MPSHNESLLELAMQRAKDGKGRLAASLAESCLAPGAALTESELRQAFDIVRMLVGTVETEIRRHLAEYLAGRDDVPDNLTGRLVNDDISVAYPVLVHCGTVRDAALVDVIAKRTKQHRMAISMRPKISAAVCEALVRTGDTDVIESLLYNKGANIPAGSMDAIVQASGAEDAYRFPLAHRHDLTDKQAGRLYSQAGDALRKRLETHFDVDRTLSARAAEDAVDRAGPEDARDRTDRNAAALRKALRNGDRHDVEVRFIACTGLDAASATRILYGRSLRALAVACHASGLSLAIFSELADHMRAGSSDRRTTGNPTSAHAVAYYASLAIDKMRETLGLWCISPFKIWRKDAC